MSFKNDPLRDQLYSKPRKYNVKIIGGKKVLIWEKEEPKKKEVFKHGEPKKTPSSSSSSGRPPSSSSLTSTYSPLPPIPAKAPPPGDQQLERFVSSQVRGVAPSVLEQLLAALVRADVGRERGLPPAAVTAAVERAGLGLAAVLPALLERFPHYYYYTGTRWA